MRYLWLEVSEQLFMGPQKEEAMRHEEINPLLTAAAAAVKDVT
jgi:hypothetical protein